MTLLGFIITILLACNCFIWLLISCLILYNLLGYTLDKRDFRKDIHPFFRKYARMI